MSTDRPVLQILIASTRPSRIGGAIGRWVAERAEDRADFEVEVVDLAEIDLPMFAESKHPRLGDYDHRHTREFSALVGRAEGFVLVFPEYNHSYNAALKNALDHLGPEWAGKPVGLVSYGGVSGGARAAVALQPVLFALTMQPVASVPVPFAARFIEDVGDGRRRFTPNTEIETGTDTMLDVLAKRLQ